MKKIILNGPWRMREALSEEWTEMTVPGSVYSALLAAGKRKRFADGEFSVAYSTFLGYDKGENGKLKVNKEQAEVVRLIYNLFLSGLTYYKIKQELEKRTTCNKKLCYR